MVAKKDTTVLRGRDTSDSLASAFSTPQGNLGARDAGVRAGKFMAYSFVGLYHDDMAQYVGSNGALAIYSAALFFTPTPAGKGAGAVKAGAAVKRAVAIEKHHTVLELPRFRRQFSASNASLS